MSMRFLFLLIMACFDLALFRCLFPPCFRRCACSSVSKCCEFRDHVVVWVRTSIVLSNKFIKGRNFSV
jgi:hypothetical protein